MLHYYDKFIKYTEALVHVRLEDILQEKDLGSFFISPKTKFEIYVLLNRNEVY